MMEQFPENSAGQGKPSDAIAPISLGAMLREARNRLGLSVADAAAQIKFAPRQIEALEADDFENLPETVYLRGFVRSYAKILNLDAQTLLASLPQANPPTVERTPVSVDVPFPSEYSAQKNLILLSAALLIAVIVAGFVVWHFTTPLKHSKIVKVETAIPLPAKIKSIAALSAKKHNKEKSNPSKSRQRKSKTVKNSRISESAQKIGKSESEQKLAVRVVKSKAVSGVRSTQTLRIVKTKAVSGVSGTQSGEPIPHHVGPVKTASIHLVFGEESWTEVTGRDGKMISSQINPSGSELNLEGQLPMSLVIGHAASAQLYVDGKPVVLAPYTRSSSEVARITLQ